MIRYSIHYYLCTFAQQGYVSFGRIGLSYVIKSWLVKALPLENLMLSVFYFLTEFKCLTCVLLHPRAVQTK